MPLHLVHDLTFETDSLELLATLLPAAIAVTRPTRLAAIPADAYAQMSEDIRGLVALDEGYPSHATAYLTNFVGGPPPSLGWQPPDQRVRNYRQICRLHDGDDRPFEVSAPIASVEAAVQRVVELARACDLGSFMTDTRGGPFSSADGTVVPGYRVHGGGMSAGLTISLCHVYYSK